jgi:DNA invertase Pin-like site-specific DNA recombinase
MLEIMEIISEAKRKDVNIHAIKNNWTLNGTIESKILLMVFSTASEIERNLISARNYRSIEGQESVRSQIRQAKKVGKDQIRSAS